MRHFFSCLVSAVFAAALSAAPEFPLTDDSKPQPQIPKGEILKDVYKAGTGSVFPGTEREYTIYLPAKFDHSKPTPFMVFQDGVIYQAPVVLDNLIAKGEIPPLVGIFVKPGVVAATSEGVLPRFNRSYEYDSVTDTYARFLMDELLPEVEKRHQFTLSRDPNDAGIAGSSSGGIAAFMVAWHRPDRFRRVYTSVGTYIGLRGGDELPVLVRKTEPKPLRIYLQGGTQDNNIYCGDWWMANQTMERSLQWVGYDVHHTWGDGGHDQKQASQIFPDVLRLLWKGWPEAKEIKISPRGDSKWKGYEILDTASQWQRVVEGRNKTSDGIGELAVQRDGSVLYADGDKVKVLLPDGKTSDWAGDKPNGGLLHLGLDTQGKLVNPPNVFSDFVINHEGKLWTVDEKTDEVLMVQQGKTVSAGFLTPLGVAKDARVTLSPDQSLLYITSPVSRYVISGQLDAEGKVHYLQPYTYLHLMDDFGAQAKGLCVDVEGRLYVSTKMGIQVCDQAGRVNFIIPTPAQPDHICFAGKDLADLVITCGRDIYKRSTKVRGLVSSQMPPIKPAAPKL